MSTVRETEDSPRQVIDGDRSLLDAVCPGWDAPPRRFLHALMRSALSYRERQIQALRFGCGFKGETYLIGEAARIFRISRVEAQAVESAALEKLQRALAPGLSGEQ